LAILEFLMLLGRWSLQEFSAGRYSALVSIVRVPGSTQEAGDVLRTAPRHREWKRQNTMRGGPQQQIFALVEQFNTTHSLPCN